MKTYAKAFVHLVGAILVAVLPLLTTNSPMGATEWMNVALVGIGAAVVWNTTNYPGWPYGKVIGSALTTALTAVNSLVEQHGLTQAAIMQIILAGVVTIAVGFIPNDTSQPVDQRSNMNPEGRHAAPDPNPE
ncbi:MAG TPA: hypothetical protein VLN58_02220 [Verrucomicrobiae bacterium]|nr:hypothetical protein [Verrucomicrobiae bacterium]